MKLKTGEKVIVSDAVKASIAEYKLRDAIAEMIQIEIKNGANEEVAKLNVLSMFKKQIIINNDDNDSELMQLLIDNGYCYDNKMSIHWATLRSYVLNLFAIF